MEQNNQNNMNNQNNQNEQAFGANYEMQTGANYTTGANHEMQMGSNYATGANEQFGTNYATENPVTESVPATEEVTAKKKSKKGLIIGIICALVAIVLAVGGVFAYKYLFAKKDDSAATESGEDEGKRKIENKDLAKLAYDDVTELEFHPNVSFNQDQLDDALEVMEERVKLLGDNYEIKADGKKITLIIEKNLLGNSAYERTQSVELIKSNGVFGIGTYYSAYDYYDTDKWTKEIKTAELKKNDILADYDTMFDENEYEKIKASESDKFKVLEITLDGDNLSEFEDNIDYIYPDSVNLWHNIVEYGDSANNMATIVFLDEDDKSKFYAISPASGFDKNCKLIEKILTSKSLELSFDTKVMDEPSWETDKKKFGKNQKDKLKGNNVVIECTPDKYTLDYVSDVDFAKHRQTIKARLDALGVDYMFGQKGFDDKTFCVKISPKEISPDFIRFIFNQKEISVRSAFDNIGSFGSSLEITDDGKLGLKVESFSDKAEIQRDYQVDSILYLVVNDVTVAAANFDDFDESDNTLTFTDFKCFDKSEAGSKEEGFVNLIASVSEEDYSSFAPESFNIRYYEGDNEKKNKNINDIDWKYSSLSETDLSTMETIRNMGHDVYKYINKRNMLVITLNVDVDENLVNSFMEEVKAVYMACGFDSGAYSQINFVIKNEKRDSFADNFRVEFTKDMYDGKMEYNERISGPKFSEYWMDAYDYLEDDAFFTERDWY